jgi:hypothetical protein
MVGCLETGNLVGSWSRWSWTVGVVDSLGDVCASALELKLFPVCRTRPARRPPFEFGDVHVLYRYPV